MEKYKCMIVEDEPLAVEILKDYIDQVPFLRLVDVCNDALLAMDILKNKAIDVVFLDMHLPRLRGLDFLKVIKNAPQIIITTAYSEYALDGYEFNVVDFLLKPIEFNRFLFAVNKLKIQATLTSSTRETHPAVSIDNRDLPHLFLNTGKKKIKVYFKNILYIESIKEYIKIVTSERTIVTKFQLGQMEQTLAEEKFLRVHRSFIVSLTKIDAFTASDIDINGKLIPIGRNYKEQVLKTLKSDTLNW